MRCIYTVEFNLFTSASPASPTCTPPPLKRHGYAAAPRRPSSRRLFSTRVADTDVVIASYARTPIACFNGSFAPLSGPELGAVANAEAVRRAGLEPAQIQEAFLGNVVSAGIGQAPARQSVLKAGFPDFIRARPSTRCARPA